jgi:chloramphenicol-sensitive protein RarD
MNNNKGILSGIGAYLIWGFLPVYLKSIHYVPALEIVFHRVVWSFLFVAIIMFVRKEWKTLRAAAAQPKTLLVYLIAAVLLGLNWLLYVWGVNTEQVVETSLGYFINPLLSVALGVIILREKLRPWQWLPVGLALVGVIYLTIEYGALPWLALALALTFGLYGLVKKISPLGSLYGLTVETAILFLPSLGYLVFAGFQGSGSFGQIGWAGSLLLAFAGVVTAVPLLLFASAAKSIPLTLVGILQYIAPTCQFLLGVLLFREPFTSVQMVGFSIIWLALIIFTLEGFITGRRKALHPIEANLS